ncbi:NAD(P)/FAD-dependent oxidoreductase [Shinella sumterensis]|uniref:Putative flavoprotein involved in K+ transport n=1 Tax=Rhizobium subbaraonis TaxID=908946 RepID=A0A285USL4_9HYPH|nr:MULTISPECIES: NAD(P)/FAD-dependent oxidoreductase [Rhizobiaceae]MCW5711711.1 NAD(P)-binding domain-containing protein [Shinella sp.]WLS08760.1 NAD(P)/FAD-dependent oxidoreductase [Shinella sumterensis]SOC44773.1 putative flavoprotein involved in K+ transport [Rhizobium subbaraonis]
MTRQLLVIGAGQAGLSAGYYLRKAGLPFLIVDAHPRVGDSWRSRYASLTLFTPRQFSALPGLQLAGNREQYPSGEEFATYLEDYAARFSLPVQSGTRVVRLWRADGGFLAETDSGKKIEANEVIVATGGFQQPIIPSISTGFSAEVQQLTPQSYHDPAELPDGPVLVVGDGASGRDIALECRTVQPVMLSRGKTRKLLPERLFGKSIWWWLQLLGILKASSESWIGRKVRAADAFPDRGQGDENLVQAGIRLVPRLVAASGETAKFSDGSSASVRTVVWATGYRDETAWVDIPSAVGPDGALSHRNGISPVPGLYFVGRPWQRNRASALVMGAGPDADLIVQEILRQQNR